MTDDSYAMVERELGERPARVEPIEEGLKHDSYRVNCGGERYVLQVARGGEGVEALRRGLFWYVAFRNSGVPVPGVVTDSVQTLDGTAYILVEHLPGETAERDVCPERVRDAGRYLARIHDFETFDRAGRLRFDGGTSVVEAFEAGSLKRWVQQRVERRAEILRDRGLETVGQEVERVFNRVGSDLPEEFEAVLCHNDYSADNVLFRDGAVTGVLDFDYAYAGHRHRDLAKAANGFWMHDPAAGWDVRAVFYEGYREETELDDSFERLEPLYRAETHAGTVASLLEMGELSESERGFYAGTIRDALERVDANAGSPQ